MSVNQSGIHRVSPPLDLLSTTLAIARLLFQKGAVVPERGLKKQD